MEELRNQSEVAPDGLTTVVWICNNHPYATRHMSTSFYQESYGHWARYQGKEYFIHYIRDFDGKESFQVSHQNDKMDVMVEVLSLDFIPKHITPDNIDQKLPTLLIFS